MKLTTAQVKHTPVFKLDARGPGPWSAAWGATQVKDGWIFPAYPPFGLPVLRGLRETVQGMDEGDDVTSAERGLLADESLCVAAEKAWSEKRFADLPLPPGYRFHRQPFKHQAYGIVLGFAKWRKFYLWDMGVGKTAVSLEVLRLLRAWGRFKRALVVVPPIVLTTWERECQKVTGGEFKAVIWSGDEVSDRDLKSIGWGKGASRADYVRAVLAARAQSADVVIVSYAMARIEAQAAAKEKRLNPLEELDYDVVIADESHSIGEWDSKQTQAALDLSSKAGRRILLSGTAADHPKKLYPQLRFLAPGLMPMGYWPYCDRYMVRHPEIHHLVLSYKNLDELNERVSMVASRMKKTECLDLPPRTTIDVPFRLGAKQSKRYNELVAEQQASVDLFLKKTHLPVVQDEVHAVNRGDLITAAKGGVRSTKLRQVLSGFLNPSPDLSLCDACPHLAECVPAEVLPHTPRCKVDPAPSPAQAPVRDFENPRLPLFKSILGNILEGDPTNKVIVWANFRQELDDIKGACDELGAGYAFIKGANPSKMREHEEAFENDPDCRVWIAQSATGVGITLNSANYTIDYAPTWDRVHDKQKRDRNYRAGQTRPVTEYRLYAEGTLDEFILATLRFKDNVAFTMLEKVACSACPHQRRCAAEENRPFKPGCVYKADVSKPKQTLGLVNDQRD